MRNKLNQFATRFENGSIGEDFAYASQLPVHVSLLVMGMMVAMIGFWRLGAFQGGERGAFTGSTAPVNGIESGKSAAAGFFNAWSNETPQATDSIASFIRRPQARTATGAIETTTSIDWTGTGVNFQFALSGSSVKRWERFYGGPPVCSGGLCSE